MESKYKYKSVNVRLPELAGERLQARAKGNISRQVYKDLTWFWSILDIGLRTAATVITRNEARLILDVMNGVFVESFEPWINGGFYQEVHDAITLDSLDKKWKINKNLLFKKIKGLDRLEIIAIIDWCFFWWLSEVESQVRELRRFKG